MTAPNPAIISNDVGDFTDALFEAVRDEDTPVHGVVIRGRGENEIVLSQDLGGPGMFFGASGVTAGDPDWAVRGRFLATPDSIQRHRDYVAAYLDKPRRTPANVQFYNAHGDYMFERQFPGGVIQPTGARPRLAQFNLLA